MGFGRPQLRALCKKIEDSGGDTWFFDQVVDGATMEVMASRLETSRPQLYHWLKKDKSGKRQQDWLDAKKLRSHGLAEDPLKQLEEASVQETRKVAEIARHKRWLAGKDNAEQYGDIPGPQLQVSIGELHLQALMAVNPSVRRAPPDLPTTKPGRGGIPNQYGPKALPAPEEAFVPEETLVEIAQREADPIEAHGL